jgi:hypothetical protein
MKRNALFRASLKLFLLFLVLLSTMPVVAVQSNPAAMQEEPLIKTVVEAGPITIGRRYRSMEGPEFVRDVPVEKLVRSGRIVIPESYVRTIKTLNSNRTVASLHAQQTITQAKIDNEVLHLVQAAQIVGPAILLSPRSARWINAACRQQLYWFRGAKLEVIDEHGKVVPGAEFLCHAGIDIDQRLHRMFFPNSSPCYDNRMFTFTQGITNMMLPEGFGVPLAGNEEIQFVLKALNRTTDRPRRISLRCTVYLSADDKLLRPIKPLRWYRAGVSVIVGSCTTHCTANSSSMCCMSTAQEAPNDVIHWVFKKPLFKNKTGQELTGHWVIIPGRHTYRTEIADRRFNRSGAIHAVISHVHPFCEKLSLIEMKPNCLAQTLFTVHCQTNNSHGIKISNIEYLKWPGTDLILDKNAKYSLEVTYNNTSGVNQDSMAVMIFLISDPKFKKPLWALRTT